MPSDLEELAVELVTLAAPLPTVCLRTCSTDPLAQSPYLPGRLASVLSHLFVVPHVLPFPDHSVTAKSYPKGMPSSWFPLPPHLLPIHPALFSVSFPPTARSPSYSPWLPMSYFASFSSFYIFCFLPLFWSSLVFSSPVS